MATQSPPILFINLATDTVRRERMEAEFARLSLHAHCLVASRRTELTPEVQDHYFSPNLNAQRYFKSLSNGERGCYASHLRACQWLLDSAHAALVVLEDDMLLEPQFASVVEAMARDIQVQPQAWDMIKLIGRPGESQGKKIKPLRPLLPGVDLVRYRRVPSLTAGYVLSRQGAQKLLASRLPFGRPVDVDLRHWWENDLRILGVVPAPIAHDPRCVVSTLGLQATTSRWAKLNERWRKFLFKARYNLLNLWHS